MMLRWKLLRAKSRFDESWYKADAQGLPSSRACKSGSSFTRVVEFYMQKTQLRLATVNTKTPEYHDMSSDKGLGDGGVTLN